MKKLLLLTLLIPQLAFADRSFYSAFSLVPGATAQGNLRYNATPFTLTATTSDGADNMVAQLSGGGAIGEARGSYVAVHGNEHANNGAVNLWGGNGIASNINSVLNNASAKIQFYNNATAVMWDFDNSGNLNQNATNGNHIIQPRALTSHLIAQGLTAIPSDINAQWYAPFYAHQSTTVGNTILSYGAANTSGPNHFLVKSRDTTGQANVVVASGDILGSYGFVGADGADFQVAALIRAVVDGTPGATDMPGRLEFRTTTDGTNALSTALTLENDQDALFTQRLTSSRTTDLGWNVVDGANNTACNTQCTSAAVFGFALTGDTAFPIIGFVGPADATADICLCAGAS